MAKKPKIEVDESLVKQVIAGQLPITTKVTRVIPEQIPSGTATDAIPAEPPSVPEIDTEKIPMKPRLCPQHKSHAVGEHHPCPIMNECFSLLWNTASEPHFMSMHRRSVRFWRYLKESEVNDYPRHHMWIIFYSTTSKLSVTI